MTNSLACKKLEFPLLEIQLFIQQRVDSGRNERF